MVNQLQKVPEWANLKLTSVVTGVMGISARAMLEATVGGEEQQEVLAVLGTVGRELFRLSVMMV